MEVISIVLWNPIIKIFDKSNQSKPKNSHKDISITIWIYITPHITLKNISILIQLINVTISGPNLGYVKDLKGYARLSSVQDMCLDFQLNCHEMPSHNLLGLTRGTRGFFWVGMRA